jgi:hypothetical protein
MARYNYRFRRSFGNKFFRFNVTKRGFGLSSGVPGFRRSWHSSGRVTTTRSIPRTGMSWRKVENIRRPKP